MIEPAIGRLVEAARALIVAAAGPDPRAIEQASEGFGHALAALKDVRGWRQIPQVAESLRGALDILDEARAHVNYHGDRNRRRLDGLAAVAGVARPIAYGRGGRQG